MLRFRVVSGEDTGEVFVLDKPSLSLGTASDNDICLRDPYVSRRHGRVSLSRDQWIYQDLGSTNGSIVESDGRQRRLGSGDPGLVLASGSRLHVGQSVLEVELAAPAPSTGTSQHTIVAHRPLSDPPDTRLDPRTRPDGLRALHELEKRLRDVSDPDDMLDIVLDALLDAFPAATHAIILLIDKQTHTPRRKAARVRGHDARPTEDVPISMSVVERVLQNGESLLLNDVAAEFENSKSVVSARIKSTLCAPLWTGNETVGLVQVESREGRAAFCEDDLDSLGVFAGRAALAIVASELRHTETRKKQLEGFSAQLVPSFIQSPDAEDAVDVRVMDASILFSDIRGYTATAERLSASDTLTMLRTYHDSVEDFIKKHGGTIVKTPGDAILAVFWKEIDGRDHAVCALDCAEEILDDLPRAARVWEAKGVQLEIGIGINVGQVAAGLVGKHHLEPTVIGDPVNVAQRLESLTKKLRCPLVFSRSVRERLPEDSTAVYLDQVGLSGRETPLEIYSLARFLPTDL